MIHPVDRLGGWLLAHGRAPAVFPDGWGDPAVASRLDLRRHPLPALDPPDLRLAALRSRDGLTVGDVGFEGSPELDPRIRTARARIVAPPRPPRGWCVLMPAWNQEGYRARTPMAVGLARRGIAAVVVENPYYGSRRIHPHGPAIRTVAEFASMGRAVIAEALALVTGLRRRGPVGVTGYSMGGNLAAFVGALGTEPLAVAPLAASHSPGPVYLGGALRRGIAWDALGPDAADRLARLLGAATVLSLPPTPVTARAVLVAARHDGFVPADATIELHRHWPGSELRWVRAGHGTLWWLRRRFLVRAVVDAFARVYRAGGSAPAPEPGEAAPGTPGHQSW